MNLKNIALAGAALSATVFCGAVSADYVESSNVVGYTGVTNLEADKFYLIASQFESVGGESVDLQDFIQSSDMQGGTDDTDSPNLKIWDGVGYTDYYFLEKDFMDTERVWTDGMFAIEGVTVNVGNGAFLKTKNTCSITVAGQVAAEASLTVPLNAGSFNLIANPFPVAFDINGTAVKFADALIGGSDDTDSPNMKIWDGIGYTDYYFLAMDFMGTENVWTDGMFAVEGVTIQPCQGFWLKYANSEENVTLQFNK